MSPETWILIGIFFVAVVPIIAATPEVIRFHRMHLMLVRMVRDVQRMTVAMDHLRAVFADTSVSLRALAAAVTETKENL